MKINRSNISANNYFLEHYNLLDKKDKILEIGSGPGKMLFELKKAAYKIVGCELENQYINFAKENFNLRLKKVDSEILPYQDNSFNKVVSFDVFEHIPDSNLHLQEVYRVLKPGGAYIFSTPNKILDVPFEIISLKSFTKYKKAHCSLQTYWSLKRLLKKNSFTCEFYSVPIKTDFLIKKAEKIFGKLVATILKVLPIDALPKVMKTNFYVVGRKI